LRFENEFQMSERLLHTDAAHFKLLPGGATSKFAARLHKKMGQAHSRIALRHEQQSDLMAEAHELSPEEFIEMQNQAAEKWITEYTASLHSGAGFSQKFAFDCAAEPRETSISAILAKYGQ
jgi:hypothetical protein